MHILAAWQFGKLFTWNINNLFDSLIQLIQAVFLAIYLKTLHKFSYLILRLINFYFKSINHFERLHWYYLYNWYSPKTFKIRMHICTSWHHRGAFVLRCICPSLLLSCNHQCLSHFCPEIIRSLLFYNFELLTTFG